MKNITAIKKVSFLPKSQNIDLRYLLFLLLLTMSACQSHLKSPRFTGADGEIKLITVAPGHFHAALLQKSALKQLNNHVQVYAPKGVELNAHLSLIKSYNTRSDNPTSWNEEVYEGDDFFEKMLHEKKGNVVVLAGNNKLKTNYILRSVEHKINVLADKPMAIDGKSFEELKDAFKIAEKKKVMLYDIMTERYDLINIVNRLLMQDTDLFGQLQSGTSEDPAVKVESVHHFFKTVSGQPLVRPAWYYDVEQQGEGIVDVTTHLIDLIHWKCFPDIALDYRKDIRMTQAKHWPTVISKANFSKSTLLNDFPDFMMKYVKDSSIYVNANGSINYAVKGVNVGIKVYWNFEAPKGTDDTYSSVIKGTKATLLILQGAEQGYKSKLYIRKEDAVDQADFMIILKRAVSKLPYPVSLKEAENGMIELDLSQNLKEGHEAHFSHVAEKYFGYLVSGKMPEWEISDMLAKYYITTTALEMARKEK